jgi:transposase-like protein
VRARDRTLLAEDLRRVYGAKGRGEALEALEALREAWGSRHPGVVALWAGDSGAFLRFYGYPKALWPRLRSTNLMERFLREIRRGTKARGQAEGLSCETCGADEKANPGFGRSIVFWNFLMRWRRSAII